MMNFDVYDQITPEQENIVRRYVNPKYFMVEDFISYLNENEIINFDIFSQCLTRRSRRFQFTFLKGFKPVNRDVFIRRIPIYFYDLNNENYSFDISSLFSSYAEYKDSDIFIRHDTFLTDILKIGYKEANYDFYAQLDLEPLYQMLEDVIYKHKLSLDKVFEYIVAQEGELEFEIFAKWFSYIGLLKQAVYDDYFPKNILYAYNIQLKKNDMKPIMYYPKYYNISDDIDDLKNGKDKNVLNIRGRFPVDENEEPVMEWIGIWTENAGKITRKKRKIDDDFVYPDPLVRRLTAELEVELTIELHDDTRIFFAKKDENNKNYWKQVYAGPKLMKLDISKIIKKRESLGYSIKDVSDGTDINIRTYQRIESNESAPDGINLLKILSFLGIKDYREVLLKETFEDDDFEKYYSGNNPSSYLTDTK